jgi:O-antigen ligase
LARVATRDFWLLLGVGVVALSIPGVARVLGELLGADSHFARFLDPVAVLAPICMLTTLVLVYPRRPVLGALGAGCFAALTLLTFTRSYWIGATGALLFLAIATARGRRRTTPGARRVWIRTAVPLFALTACAVVVLLATPIGGFVSDRFHPERTNDASVTQREQELGAALAHVRAHPVTGLGSGGKYLTLSLTSAKTLRFGPTNFVHNAYVYLPLKFGLLGFAALAALILGTVRVIGFALSTHSREVAGRVLFTAALLFFLLASITAPNLVDPKYSLLAGAVAWLAGVPSRAL